MHGEFLKSIGGKSGRAYKLLKLSHLPYSRECLRGIIAGIVCKLDFPPKFVDIGFANTYPLVEFIFVNR